MHRVVVDEPYQFVPPYRGRWFSWLFRLWLKPFLKNRYGLVDYRFEGAEHLRDSLRAGHGVILCPNHSRDSDPMLMGMVCREIPCHVYSMASWHVFKQSPLEGFVARMLGGFSVFREGIDREALDTAVQAVVSGERPLVIFPEGVISRSNDRLLGLMDGVSFIGRVAARKRAEQNPAGKVVIHPMAIRYELIGDLHNCIGPTLTRLEQRTFWKTFEQCSHRDRIRRLALALLASREVEVLGDSRQGPLRERIQSLINAVLQPRERRWFGRAKTGDVVGRVKDLRAAVLPELMQPGLSAAGKQELWNVLTECYYVQTLSLYPQDYLDDGVRGPLTPERIAETVHRLEEDLTDRITLKPDWRVHLRIGAPIVVEPGRKPRGEDTVMKELRTQMLSLLGVADWWIPEPIRTLDDDVSPSEMPK